MSQWEYLDVVDDNNNVIRTANKEEVYEKVLPHRIVHVVIFDTKGRMLLQRRSKTKKYCPDCRTTSVGGHVQSGENYENAAFREMKEEIGIEVPIEKVGEFLWLGDNNIKKFIGVFAAEYEGKFTLDPREVQFVDYFSLEEIKQKIILKESFHPELEQILKNIYNL